MQPVGTQRVTPRPGIATRYANAEATHRMWEAFHFGRSPILVTHFERAELYLEQFQERGLAVTMEPA